jgi:hypothetical protein
VTGQDYTEDESEDEDTEQFLRMMDQAERRNHRKLSGVQQAAD